MTAANTVQHSSTELLDVARSAERWIHSHQAETKHGLLWGLADEAPDKRFHNVYSGSAGIALFYLELQRATGDGSYLDTGRRAGDELLHAMQSWGALPCAPMGGWGGYLFCFQELYQATGDVRFRDAAATCAERQRGQAEDIGAGIGWVQEMPYAKLTGHSGQRELFDVAEGAAGAGLCLLYAQRHGVHDSALSWARQAADRLLEVAEPAEGGLRWQLMEDIPWPFDAPNFAHGTAGVAFFMARMFEETQEAGYLEAALAGAGHVQAMAEPQTGGGHLVPHVLNDGRPNRYYLGMCHGPAGTTRLFHQLEVVTGDASWRTWSRGLDEGLVGTGAPEQRTRGFWNNISQCCCDAGIGDHAVYRYRVTGETFYLDLARRVAAELIRRAVPVDGQPGAIRWPQAEHRGQPDFIQAQTGYMQGAAGVGSFFVHLASVLDGEPVKICFPESPYHGC